MAIDTFIIAAIALAVLVVFFYIFIGQSSATAKTIQSCKLKEGECAQDLLSNKDIKDPKKYSCNDKTYNVPVILNDPACGESKLCCLKIG